MGIRDGSQMNYLRSIFELVKETGAGYGRDKGGLLAAALAYHTIFSLAPLLVIAVAVAGYFFGQSSVTGDLVMQVETTAGTGAADVVRNLISNASAGAGVAAIISTALTFWGASGVFNQLKSALNQIWGIVPPPDQGIVGVVRTRLLAVVMVMGIGFVLLIAMVSNAVLGALDEQLVEWMPQVGGILPLLSFAVTFVVVTLLFAVIFKTLPDATVTWRDALVGGSVTSLLFGIGQWAMGLYLGNASVGSAYGAASSLIVLLFWIYISAQIVMFGAEFTQVYANNYGSGVKPDAGALVLKREAATNEAADEAASTQVSSPAHQPLAPVLPTDSGPPRLAIGLLGLAGGLFLGFVGSLLRDR